MPAKSDARADRPAGVPVTWNWFSHGTLRGLTLERESLSIVAWDDARHLYRLHPQGRLESETRLEDDIRLVACSDTGQRTFVLGTGLNLKIFDRSGKTLHQIPVPFDPRALAVDPFGDYIAIASSDARLAILNRAGKVIGRAETPQPYRHLSFVPATGQWVAAAEQGVVAGHDDKGNLLWKETMYSTIGNMAMDEAGRTVALAAFGYGVVRFDANGRREGAYQLPRPPHLVAIDFDGSKLVASSVDGYLIVLNYDGHILAERALAEKAIGIAMDPLSRFVVLAFASGEIRFFAMDHLIESSPDQEDSIDITRTIATDPNTSWSIVVAGSEDEVAASILEPLESERMIALSTPRRTIRILTRDGLDAHESVRLEGTGLILRAAPGGLFAATDRRLLFYDALSHRSKTLPLDYFDISHLLPLPSVGEAIVVESCDQISRVSSSGTTRWRQRLPIRVASMAVDHQERTAMVLEDHQLVILSPDGSRVGRFRAANPMPMLVTDIADGWVTTSIGEQMLRYHDVDGRARSSFVLPWDPWGLWSIGRMVVVTSANGLAVIIDPSSNEVTECTEKREGSSYFEMADGRIARAFRSGPSVAVTDVASKLLWRSQPLGTVHQFAVRAEGAWILAGHSLGFYPLPR